MHTQLQGLLAAVESGDFDAFGPLADYPEERGDPRADLALNVMKLEPALIAQALCEIRMPPRSSEDWRTGLEATLAGGMFGLALVFLAGVAARDMTPSVAATGFDEALMEVEEAIRTRSYRRTWPRRSLLQGSRNATGCWRNSES